MAGTADFVGSHPLLGFATIHKFEYSWILEVPFPAANEVLESPIVHTTKDTFNIAWRFVCSFGESGDNFVARLLSIDNEEVDVSFNSYLIVGQHEFHSEVCVMKDKFYKHQSSVNRWEESFEEPKIFDAIVDRKNYFRGKSLQMLRRPCHKIPCRCLEDMPTKFRIEFKVMEMKCHAKPSLELSRNLGAFRSQGQSLSDFTFVVNKKEFQAHKAILIARSPVFATMLSIDMLEKRDNRIYLEDVEPDVFEQFLDFVYSGRVDSCGANDCEAWAELLFVAEKYDLQDLKEICMDMIASRFCVEDMTKIFDVANLLNDENLKRAAVDFVVGQEESVKESEAYKKLVEAHPFLLNEMKNSN